MLLQGDHWLITQVKFGSAADKIGLEQGFFIVFGEKPANRPDKEWVFIPVMMLLFIIIGLQRRRLAKNS